MVVDSTKEMENEPDSVRGYSISVVLRVRGACWGTRLQDVHTGEEE